MTSTDELYVGIDVSKRQLDVRVHSREEHWQFGNELEGIGELVTFLQGLEPTLITTEATGGYEMVMVERDECGRPSRGGSESDAGASLR